MKISKLLNRKYFIILSAIILSVHSVAEESPVDIWNIEKEDTKVETTSNLNSETLEDKKKNEMKIYEMQSQKKASKIKLEENISSENLRIVGLYDPQDYGLDIDMWSNSDGDQLKSIFSKLYEIPLSEDASEIMNISMLTNAYFPKKNISEKEFLKFKSDWLVKNSDLELIETYLIENQIIDLHPKLSKYLVDQHLSEANTTKACKIFLKNTKPINDEYLSKFNIYCLTINGKKDEAQIIFDLKKETGFKDKYFENKINFLFGYTQEVDKTISEKSILDFHIAHQTNPQFVFEPNEKTNKIIWKYLSSANLLNSFKKIEISDLEKISTIELAVHNKNYPEKDLLNLYKQFQFSIDQLLNFEDAYKSINNIEARALIYQKILLESEMVEKLKLLKILKNLFKKDNINNAFDTELKKFLEKVDPLEIPDNLTSFYYTNIEIKKELNKKIKFNNDILHQSKLINYFNGDYSKSKIEKDLNNLLRKIKKNKKYFFSKKDQIFLESLRSDGIKIDKKFDDLYEINTSEIPTDIQVMINNNEKGAALLRIAEVIGEDDLERIDEDTIYFIISTLNQLKIDLLRNQILLKVLPLKV